MRNFLRLTFATLILSFLIPCLRADDSPFTLPAGEPMATLLLPEGLALGNVSIAISKALVEEEWENLGWEGNVTTAVSKHSRVNMKVFAVATATGVQLYAAFSSENNGADDKSRQVVLRQLRSLEKTIAAKLNLSFKKAKGEETVDRATS